jgi:hypothetical protein
VLLQTRLLAKRYYHFDQHLPPQDDDRTTAKATPTANEEHA